MSQRSRTELAVELGTSVELWRIRFDDDSFICDRAVYDVAQWEKHEALWHRIDDAAHRNDVVQVESLMAQTVLLGKHAKQGVFASGDEAINYFEQGRRKLAEKAHKFVAQVDKSLGNWSPAGRPSTHL